MAALQKLRINNDNLQESLQNLQDATIVDLDATQTNFTSTSMNVQPMKLIGQI